MDDKFILIYFTGCPNYPPAKELLKQCNIEYSEVCQDDLKVSDPMKRYSSPTLLMDGKIVFGSETSDTGGSCSLKLPSLSELLESIRRLSRDEI